MCSPVPFIPPSSPGLTGRSSTPRPLRPHRAASGILDPRFRGDDSGGRFSLSDANELEQGGYIMNIRSNPDTTLPAVTTGPLPSSRKIFATPDAAPDLRVPLREIILSEGAGEPNLPVYDTSGPYTDPSVTIDVNAGLSRNRLAWVKERGGVEEYQGREIKPEDNGNVGASHAAKAFTAHHKPLRGTGRPQDHAARIRPRRHHHQGDDLRRRAREPRPQAAARARGSSAGRRRKLWRRSPRLHHAGIRALRDRARPRHHSLQHQPRRTRADDHRPQFPDQDQRQYRQLRRHLVGRRGSRQDGVGDPLGRRHRDGPLDRPQHPHHPRMDSSKCADPDRHRSDLPGAGEVRRRSGKTDLGALQGHADRAVRTGRRLFYDPRRRAPALHPPHRQPRHRHRVARRLDHGEVVPGASQGELPLYALRRDLRPHAQV